MVSMLTALLFSGAFAFALWTMVVTIRPRLGRILFLLEHGPLPTAALPPRVMLRGRSAPVRVTAPRRLRVAA